jgi:hypothetical protein
MKTPPTSRLIPCRLLLIPLLTLPFVCLPSTIAEQPRTTASAVQPFVDSNTLAGAVMLVASKDRVLSLEAAGWSDLAARKLMQTDALFWIAF